MLGKVVFFYVEMEIFSAHVCLCVIYDGATLLGELLLIARC